MADAFSFLVSALASSARPDDVKRRKELDAIIKNAGVEADSNANPDTESAAEDTYESTDEGMRRKRKGS